MNLAHVYMEGLVIGMAVFPWMVARSKSVWTNTRDIIVGSLITGILVAVLWPLALCALVGIILAKVID